MGTRNACPRSETNLGLPLPAPTRTASTIETSSLSRFTAKRARSIWRITLNGSITLNGILTTRRKRGCAVRVEIALGSLFNAAAISASRLTRSLLTSLLTNSSAFSNVGSSDFSVNFLPQSVPLLPIPVALPFQLLAQALVLALPPFQFGDQVVARSGASARLHMRVTLRFDRKYKGKL